MQFNNSINEIKISQNRWKSLLLIFGSFCFTVLCAIFFFIDYDSKIITIIIKIAMPIGVIFFGFGTIYFIIKMISNKYILIVDEKGITDNSSALSLGFIAWEDIESVNHIFFWETIILN